MSRTPTSLRIYLLDGFRVEVDRAAVPDSAWHGNRAKAVVKLLALGPGHRLHREEVMDLLWPDLDQQAAAANLRKALHFARRALGGACLTVRSGRVALESDTIWVDVAAFEVAARDGRTGDAIAVYAGDLLPEDRFESWADEPRTRLQMRFKGLLLDHASELERAGDLRSAELALERLTAGDPLNEEAVLALMRVHAGGGRRSLALRLYASLADRLQAELGVAPGSELRRLKEEIADGRFPGRDAAGELAAEIDSGRPRQATAAEQIRLATVLVAEGAPEAPDPERLRTRQEAIQRRITAVVEDWGGRAEPLAGGLVLAAFGVSRVHEDDAARALEAALELSVPGDRLRIGVSTGSVIVPGKADAPLRDVAGDAIALAGRLREAAAVGTVLVGERTRRAAGPAFSFSPPLRLKPDRLTARRLLGRVPELPTAPDGGPFVGRARELAAVLDLFEEVVERGRPRLVQISGPAGIGKSRLAREFAAALRDRHPTAIVWGGRCLPARRGSAYDALAEMVRELGEVGLSDTPEKAWQRLVRRVGALIPGADRADVAELAFALATTAGIAAPQNSLDSVSPEAVGEQLGIAWPRFLSGCAAVRPVVVIVEDLHWASEALLAIVERIARRSTGPLMLVATARPELVHTRSERGVAGEGATGISLQPLTDSQSQELLEGLPLVRSLTLDLRERVVERAEGNPFFLEELLYHVAGQAATTVPDSLYSLLAARLDALEPSPLWVLQVAAVVGRTFWAEAVQRGAPFEPVRPMLDRLEAEGFIVRQPRSSLPGLTELAFRHALLHDVAYESLPRTIRARLHATVAEWMEAATPGRRDEIEEVLAGHWASAAAADVADVAWPHPERREEVRRLAFQHLVRAGQLARGRFAIASALDSHERALSLAATVEERVRAHEELGDDHAATYHGDAARVAYEEALREARADSSRSAPRGQLYRKLAWMLAFNPGAFRANPDPADVEALIAEGQVTVGDDTDRAWLLLAEGACARLYRGSEPFGQGTRTDSRPIGERIEAAERGLRMGEASGSEELVTAGRQALGMLYGVAGRHAEAMALSRREVDGLQATTPRLRRADALRNLGVQTIHVSAGFEEGLELGRRSLEISRDISPHQVMHATYTVLAALFYLGRWKELVIALDEHLAAFRQEPATECQFVRDGPVIGAVVMLLTGRARRARQLAALAGDPLDDIDGASAWQARHAVIAGDPGTARVIVAGKVLEGRTYGPQHAVALVEAQVALRDWDALSVSLPGARRLFSGNALLGPFCDRAEGVLAAARQQPARARRLLAGALEEFQRLQIPFEEARTAELLAPYEATGVGAELVSRARRTYARLGVSLSAAGGRAVDTGGAPSSRPGRSSGPPRPTPIRR